MHIYKCSEYFEKLKIRPVNAKDLSTNTKMVRPDDKVKPFLNQYLKDKTFLDNFDSIRKLKTGNIELISYKAKYKDNDAIKVVLYITEDPPYWRRWRPNFGNLKYGWTRSPYVERNCTDTQELMDSFYTWFIKNVKF